MENWHEAYKNELSSLLDNIIPKKGVIVGFNVNIDKIIEIFPEKLANLISAESDFVFNEETIPPKIIESPKDLLIRLILSIQNGKADEILITSKKTNDWIEKNFVISKVKLGGQAGIIANLLRKINLNQVLLSLPAYNSVLSELLDSRILTVVEKNDGFSVQEIKNLDLVEGNNISHYIFEFKAGEYIIGKHRLLCKRANRFIVSFDNVNSLLKFNKGILEGCSHFIQDYSLAILSGFHLVNTDLNTSHSYRDVILPIVKMISKWKENNPNLFIHLETASTQDIKLREVIIELIFPLVDSVGINEQELLSFVEVLNSDVAISMQKDMSSLKLFEGMQVLFNKFPDIRIHLHNLGYFLILSNLRDIDEINRRKRSLIHASLFAAAKAQKGVIDSVSDISDVSIDLSTSGYEELRKLHSYIQSKYSVTGNLIKDGYLSTPSFTLTGIPTIVIKNAAELVGLGDTISSISVLMDIE